jgi:hypothetical protein
MDGSDKNPKSIKKEFINAENINNLFKKYIVPFDLDLLSIDIDSNDFWVWKALDQKYKPRLVVIEYNATISPNKARSVKYDSKLVWDGGSDYFGASLMALYKLGLNKGYDLVYCDKSGVNSFFVRSDILGEKLIPLKPREAYRPYGHKMPARSKNKMIRLSKDDFMISTKNKKNFLRRFSTIIKK